MKKKADPLNEKPKIPSPERAGGEKSDLGGIQYHNPQTGAVTTINLDRPSDVKEALIAIMSNDLRSSSEIDEEHVGALVELHSIAKKYKSALLMNICTEFLLARKSKSGFAVGKAVEAFKGVDDFSRNREENMLSGGRNDRFRRD